MTLIEKIPARTRFFLTIGLASAAAFILTIQLFSRWQYQGGRNMLGAAKPAPAMTRLDAAARWMIWNGGRFLFQDDLRRIRVCQGQAAHRQAASASVEIAVDHLRRAVEYFRQALAIHPRDIDAVRGIARSLAAWETLAEKAGGTVDMPENPRPYYEALTRFRPNSVSAHYSLARYDHRKGRDESIQKIIGRIISIYPNAYGHLVREPFYSENLIPVIKDSLNQAAAQGTDPRSAYSILAGILEKEDRPAEAIEHYRKALGIHPSQNRADHYLRLGQLYLKNSDPENAQAAFLQALSMGSDFEALLGRIYGVFNTEGRLHKFIELSAAVEQRLPSSPALDLWTARAWMNLNETELARRKIEPLLERNPTAEVYALLAEIAAKAQDWDAMELAAQRAAILDEADFRNWRTLIEALRHQGKHLQAEQAASQAIARSPEPNAWLFNSRAWLRWELKMFDAALEDWLRASALIPQHADFLYRVARIYEDRKDWEKTRQYLQRALSLEPENVNFRQMQARVEAGEAAP